MRSITLSQDLTDAKKNLENKTLTDIKTARELVLEEIHGVEARNFVEVQNNIVANEFSRSLFFQKMQHGHLDILADKSKIPYISFHHGLVYNFWRDENNKQGIWRRTNLEDYKKQNPNWEVLLDIDHLPDPNGWLELTNKSTDSNKKNWVCKGIMINPENTGSVLIELSYGGKDAVVIREFDLNSRKFIEEGFKLKEAKQNVTWFNQNSLLISDCSAGLTKAGYPMGIKLWQRGKPIGESIKIDFPYKESDFRCVPVSIMGFETNYFYIKRTLTVNENEFYFLDQETLKTTLIPLPKLADIGTFINLQIIITLREDWTVPNGPSYKAGSIIALDLNSIQDPQHLKTSLVFAPTPTMVVGSVSRTKNFIIVKLINNVCGEVLRFQHIENNWVSSLFPLPKGGDMSVKHGETNSDDLLITYESFLQPPTYYLFDGNKNTLEVLKVDPATFEANHFITAQLSAKSKDGTLVPYFAIYPKNLQFNGKNPTQLYGYGAFNNPLLPCYLKQKGPFWLSQGGIYVIANIRGGGEFGPSWHQAGYRENRPRSIEDFIAVAEDLIAKNFTSPKHLGILGGSAGGILVGAAFNLRPDLFRAAWCLNPVLDLLHFHKMGAGHKSIGEYGDPENHKTREVLKSISPFHNIKHSSIQQYPEVLFTTSTEDDRVPPGHARKMADQMITCGHKVYFYENNEGGHGGSANFDQQAYLNTLGHSFMMRTLMNYNLHQHEQEILVEILHKAPHLLFSKLSKSYADKSLVEHVVEYAIEDPKSKVRP